MSQDANEDLKGADPHEGRSQRRGHGGSRMSRSAPSTSTPLPTPLATVQDPCRIPPAVAKPHARSRTPRLPDRGGVGPSGEKSAGKVQRAGIPKPPHLFSSSGGGPRQFRPAVRTPAARSGCAAIGHASIWRSTTHRRVALRPSPSAFSAGSFPVMPRARLPGDSPASGGPERIRCLLKVTPDCPIILRLAALLDEEVGFSPLFFVIGTRSRDTTGRRRPQRHGPRDTRRTRR